MKMGTLSKSDLETILRNVLDDKTFDLISYELNNGSNISQGFLSSVEKVRIYYKVENVIENISVFVKRQPLGSTHSEQVASMGLFRREVDTFVLFLKEMYPKLNGIIPACFLANNDTLVMEDLSLKGFRNLDVFVPFDHEHCLKVADCLAKLHAASFFCEQKRQIKVNKLVPDLEKELIFSKEENHVGRKRHFVGVKALKKFAEVYLAQYSKDVVGRAFDVLTALPDKLDPSTRHPNVLCHSDLWPNNIMFSYEIDGRVSKACLIDFQISSYRPPTFDLQLFMYCCTNREIRRQHFDHISRYYFAQLQDNLQQAGIDPDDIVSSEVFTSMSEDTLPIAMALAPQFMHFAGLPPHLLKPIMEDDKKWKKYYEEDRDGVVLQAASESLPYRNALIEGLEDLFNYFKEVRATK